MLQRHVKKMAEFSKLLMIIIKFPRIKILDRDKVWVNDQLDAQLHYKIRFYCYNPLRVSSKSVLIIRRSNCIITTSGIVFSVSDRPVCRCTLDGHLQRILYQMLY